MAESTKEFFEKFKKDAGKMKELMPGAVNSFMSLFAGIVQDGVLSAKEKEFIALGIAVAQQCEPCIKLHTQKCLAAGAAKEQILEAASVAIMMAGGPAYTHIPVVVDTLEALTG